MLLRSARRAVGRRLEAPLGAAPRHRSTGASLTADVDADWARAKPFESIPGPKPYPVLGSIPHLLPGIGKYGKDMLEMQVVLQKDFGDIVRVNKILGRKDLVFLFDPKLTEKMYRNEGIWPIRDGVKTIHYYRTILRKEKFEGALGTITTQGKEWADFRSKVNQPLMQPKSARRYFAPINAVAEDFIGRMRDLQDENKELPEYFINELYKWSLESIALVALDTRLGCLAPHLPSDSEPQHMIDAVQVILQGIHELDMKFSLWQWISTPMWRRMVKALDYFYDVAEKYVHEAVTRNACRKDREPSILERLMEQDHKVATVMASDMLFGGVDTTSHTAAAFLFYLAKSPRVQSKLFEEVRRALPTPQTPFTEEALDQMPYLKACLRETLRIFPVALNNARRTQKPIVLGEYQIPEDVDVVLCHMVMSRDERNYPRPLSFEPERWLRGGPRAHAAHPFATLPFGFGPRTCVGRRFAELEVQTLVAKILRNFRLEYHYADEIKFASGAINSVTLPLKFRLLDRE